MRKAIVLAVVCLMVCTAWATDYAGSVNRTLLPFSGTLPGLNERAGSCEIYNYDPAGGASLWGPTIGESYAVYLDPSLDGHGGCTTPFYPFHIDTVDLPLAVWGDSPVVGMTVCYTVYIECPKDEASANIVRECKGPGGTVLCSTQICYTITEADSVNGIVEPRVPVDCCVSNGFYVVVTVDSYTGDNNFIPSVILNYGPVDTGWRPCTSWAYIQLGLGGGIISDYCWFEMRIDVNWGGTPPNHAGPWWVSVHGDAGSTCEPTACTGCPRHYPGDDASNPILVTGSGDVVVDLCQFCSDYDQRFDDQIPAGSFTAPGGDAVLEIQFDPNLPQACFQITLTPIVAPTTPFRIRSWLNDSFGTLYDGNPRFPLFGASQVYNFTASGLGCLPPDNYLLYLDTRGCCAPVRVTYSGDQPLPVEFSDFHAVSGNGTVSLSWTTASERDLGHFEITRDGELVNSTTATNNATGHTYTFVDHNVTNGHSYLYRLSAVSTDGAVTFNTTTVTGTPRANIVTAYALSQNYPNPFNPNTSISYAVKDAGLVTLKVYTIDGREVATLVNGSQPAGNYTIAFDGTNLASGVYLYKLEVNGFTASHKMVLMK